MLLFPIQQFIPASVPSMQGMLLSMAEYVSGTITTSSADNQQYIFKAIQQTLMSALHIIDAYQIQSLMQQEYSLLLNLVPILTNLSINDQNLINSRLASFNSLNETIYTLPTSVPLTINNLNSGQSALPDDDLLSYLVNFDFEVPPVGLTLDLTNFLDNSDAMAAAWLDALTYLQMNGNVQQISAYGPTERMYYSCLDTSNFVSNMVFSNKLNSTQTMQMWNSLVALPTLLRVSSLLYNDPSSQLSQSINCIKFVISNLIIETNRVLSTFTVPNNLQKPQTAKLRVNESLLDFAARTTGDFSNWESVASANNLFPPYVGTVAAPGIAIPGQKLFLPPFSVNSPIANYDDAFLGTDIDIGPPYSNLEMWTGDFSLIRGINNYLGALARRVLTPVGSLIYHTSYGSLIPGEIGNVSTANEAMLLSSYLKSALLSDTRTQTVNQITAYPVNFGQIVMTAIVSPYGSADQVPFNLVIIPQGGGTAKLI
jgi:hypothetical protein